MRVLRTFVCAVAGVQAAAGCHRGAETAVDPAALRNVPIQVKVAGETLYLESYLWRDYMPVAPPEGRPLSAVFRIKAVGGTMPRGISADSAWVIFGDQVWATAPRLTHPPEAGEVEFLARDGPRWPTDSAVDVVLRVRSGGATMLVRSASQRIRRTD